MLSGFRSRFAARLSWDHVRETTRAINPHNETTAAVLTFAGSALIRLFSSIVLTRLLYPEAYGIVGMLLAVLYILDMTSDIGVIGLLVRHERGSDPTFVNTLWTIRLIRNCINGSLLVLAAPFIARLYDAPDLTLALQVFSIAYLLKSAESMSFVTLVRDKRSRVVGYYELLAQFLSALFVIAFSYFRQDHWGIILGMLLAQLLEMVFSYCVRGAPIPRFRLERQALRDVFNFAKYVTPSSYLSIVLTQYEKLALPKLFDLRMMGLYNVAGGISGPVESLVIKLSRQVLYPRLAEYHRSDPSTLRDRFYGENRRFFMVLLGLPAFAFGCAELAIHILFDPRYEYAGIIAQALCIRAMLTALLGPSEDMLVARGEPASVMIGNAIRLTWLIPGSLLGYHFFGFPGFLYAAVLDVLAALVFFWWRRGRLGLLTIRYEMIMVAYMLAIAAPVWGLSSLALRVFSL